MKDITRILSKIEAGDQQASEELLPLVYDELRKLAGARMARERPDHTLQATALVHEAYLRLVNPEEVNEWASRAQFFAAAAEAMRRILVDSIRQKQAAKRGGGVAKAAAKAIDLAEAFEMDADLFLDLDEKLRELESIDQPVANLAKLHLFGGFSVTEAGEFLGQSRTSAYKSWRYARSWLQSRMAAADT